MLEGHNADIPRKLEYLDARPAREVVNQLETQLTHAIVESLEIALDTCATVTTHRPDGIHLYTHKTSEQRKRLQLQVRSVKRKL